MKKCQLDLTLRKSVKSILMHRTFLISSLIEIPSVFREWRGILCS